MLISIAMMFLVGMSMGWICKKIHLPSLFGMIVTGIVLGPYVLDVIDASILNISSDLRRIALIIILMRAGLSLDLNDLKKVGRPAVLMCFVPACFEIGGMILLAPKLLGISILDAAIMGTVIAAVSPAVIVPKMLKLMEEKRVNRLVTVPAVLLEKVMVMAGSEIYRLHAVGSENGGDGDAFVREEREIMRVMRQALDGENG